MRILYGLYLACVLPLMVTSGHIQADDTSCCEYNLCHDYYSCSDDKRFFIKADALYLRAQQEGIDSFINGSISEGMSTTAQPGNDSIYNSENFSKQKRQRFHFDWRGGYRIGFGYNYCDGWIVAVDWTQYQGVATGHQSPPKASRFILPNDPQFTGKGLSENTSKGFGHWKLDYDVLDIIVRTPTYCAASCFSWNIFGGLKAAFIDQKVRLKSKSHSTNSNIYTNSASLSESDSLSKNRYRTNYSAIGPQLGFNASWNLGCGFSLYGNAAGALVYANFHNKFKGKSHSSSSSLSTSISSSSTSTSTGKSSSISRNSDRLCRPVLDLGLGVSWLRQLCYCGQESTLMVRLGWEHHQWFDQDQLGSGGDLYLDGFALSGSVFF